MLSAFYSPASKWLNDNQGVVSVAIFAITVAFAWASGIFSALRRRPQFKLHLLEGPTFCCTYPVGKKHGNFDVHRTGIALYLSLSNVGSAPSSLANISVAYHWHLHPFSVQWLKYSVGWFWLTSQTAALDAFQVKIGENIKVYPFLTQRNFLSPANPETYLEVGQASNGVVYFEQTDSWGGCLPSVRNGLVRIKVSIQDVFGGRHTKRFVIPAVTVAAARKYNPSFGKTLAELRSEKLPFDTEAIPEDLPLANDCTRS
ncbi:hypothetical protein [Paraburkholderia ginsengisoli]|uniref:Uncharacterized protein n=1 Tax=Paraburkholderia ginsengisoli TaxID=311231 RepID=A0A7T4N523_9BURK|nr:hypothetical protein [Paraburkholderia ginsengisoli]QQC65323.1 hypothetical protein I6I06_07670 [Paraburkholderia ginsengisoli]